MLTLALVFQTLAVRKPDLDNGVFVYARAGLPVRRRFWASVRGGENGCRDAT